MIQILHCENYVQYQSQICFNYSTGPKFVGRLSWPRLHPVRFERNAVRGIYASIVS